MEGVQAPDLNQTLCRPLGVRCEGESAEFWGASYLGSAGFKSPVFLCAAAVSAWTLGKPSEKWQDRFRAGQTYCWRRHGSQQGAHCQDEWLLALNTHGSSLEGQEAKKHCQLHNGILFEETMQSSRAICLAPGCTPSCNKIWGWGGGLARVCLHASHSSLWCRADGLMA